MTRPLAVSLLALAGCLSAPEGDENATDAGASCPDPMTAPGGGCPGQCSDGCDGATCRISCTGAVCEVVECPAGFDCEVSCVGKDRCVGSIVICPEEYACSLLCSGEDACEAATLRCGQGRCEIECSGHALSCSNTTVMCGGGPCVATCEGVTVTPDLECDSSCQCEVCDLTVTSGTRPDPTALPR